MRMLSLLSLYYFFPLFLGFSVEDFLFPVSVLSSFLIFFISGNGEYKGRVGEIDGELGQLVQGNDNNTIFFSNGKF